MFFQVPLFFYGAQVATFIKKKNKQTISVTLNILRREDVVSMCV